MTLKSVMVGAGIGVAAGAVAVLMMPKSNPARQLAAKTANKMEDAACKMTDKLSGKMEM